jgi:AraC-like DNA-binding protein
MISELLPYYFFTAGIIGLVVSIILLVTQNYFSQKFFLSICFFCVSVCSFSSFCSITGYIAYLPYLHILSRAVMFLIAPCCYLYVRNTFGSIHRIKRYDLLHFVPFMLFLIIGTNICLANPDGFMKFISNGDVSALSNFSVIENLYSFNMLLWLFYIVLQVICILKFEYRESKSNNYCNRKITDWVKFLNLLLILAFFLSMINKIHVYRSSNIDMIQGFCLSFMMLVAAFYLLFNPQILYNISQTEVPVYSNKQLKEEAGEVSNPCITQLFSSKQRDQYLQILSEVFMQQKPFLKKGFSIKDLSALTAIPTHHLSFLINHEFNLPFQDFINLKRIEYMKTNMTSAEWGKLSLEGIAWEVGFNSRTTFFRSFVKLTGISPSEYINSLEREKNVSA